MGVPPFLRGILAVFHASTCFSCLSLPLFPQRLRREKGNPRVLSNYITKKYGEARIVKDMTEAACVAEMMRMYQEIVAR